MTDVHYADMIDASRVHVVKSYPDAMSWPIAVGIASIAMNDRDGVVPTINGLDRWPNFRKAGWDGDLVYTLWAGFEIAGVWYMSGFHQFWRDRYGTGANPLQIAGDGPLPTKPNWCSNWVDVRKGWGPLDDFVPTPGIPMAFMVTTGDARMGGDNDPSVLKMKERSQIVTVPLSANGIWSFVPNKPDTPQPPTPDKPPVPDVPSDLLELLQTLRDEIILTKLQGAELFEKVDGLIGNVVALAETVKNQPTMTAPDYEGRLTFKVLGMNTSADILLTPKAGQS